MWYIRKSLTMASMGMKTTLAYAASVWASIFVNILQVVVFYYIWSAVYSGKESLNGITFNEMVTYIILSRVLFMGISWGVNSWMAHHIQTGAISSELLRPIDYQYALYTSRLGDFLMFTVLNGIPVLLVSVIMFGMLSPASLSAGFLFLVSILMSITIAFFIEFIVGLLSFYTTNGWGLQVLKEAVMNFLSGAIVPLAFFPSILKNVIEWLPFKDMVYTPISIYLGFLKGQEVYEALMIQAIWIIVLWIGTRIFYKIALKKVVIQGG